MNERNRKTQDQKYENRENQLKKRNDMKEKVKTQQRPVSENENQKIFIERDIGLHSEV